MIEREKNIKMNIFIIIGFFILLLLFLFLRSERKRGRYLYDMATDLENNKDYEAACFYYATAMQTRYNKILCQKKIKQLWQIHGPFNFQKQLKEAKSNCRYESCGEGFHSLTVSGIHKIVDPIK